MARGGKKNGKKPVASRRGASSSRGAAAAPAAAAGTPDAAPEPAKVVPLDGARVNEYAKPRTTNDDPWRDLHPARVWPD
jgi:hypothetical protein